MEPTRDVSRIFDTASLHLMTSTFEGFGMSIVEAAWAGVPTMAFVCSPGVAEVVTPTQGFPVRPGDAATSPLV